jgi:hypothetical protein
VSEVYRVRRGDCIASIALHFGFAPGTLWDHPANAALRRERVDPYVLFEGDEVFLPDKRVAEFSRPTGAVHTFRRQGVPQRFTVRLVDGERPRAGLSYVLDVAGRHYTGVTDDDGAVSHWIPPDARAGTLAVGDDGTEVYALEFGRLDPATTRSGFLARLCNLGRLDPARLGDDAACDAAIAAFKLEYCTPERPDEPDSDSDGGDGDGDGDMADTPRAKLAELDADTAAVLVRVHGS